MRHTTTPTPAANPFTPRAVEIRVRADGAATTLHAITENAPQSLCGVDRSILEPINNAHPHRGARHCHACSTNLERMVASGYFTGRIGQ